VPTVAEFFSLSPAESRLAGALMKGRRLSEIAHGNGVEITTLRTQLSSVLRKVDVSARSIWSGSCRASVRPIRAPPEPHDADLTWVL
jgi:DNA-binding CsgD family transcriptional regulator